MNAQQLYTMAGINWIKAAELETLPADEHRDFLIGAYGRSYAQQIELARNARLAS